MDRIQVEQVSKRYRLGERHNLRESLTAMARLRRPSSLDLWSLRDVTFTVPDGDSLGIVGRNGAGKSTILKILMRITAPTVGASRTRGRVAALLEVGTGFHPELTGRENVFLNGAVLGMSRADTLRRFDDIVTFAGIEQFLDTPVKRYSSGMYLRLAFAVAAHLEPDILIVDEVLAVGDAEFQRKCLGRMSEAEREGRTVVFVSHDLSSLTRLCRRAIWLESGRVRQDGPAPEVVSDYLAAGFVATEVGGQHFANRGSVELREVRVVAAFGAEDRPLMREDPLEVIVKFEVHAEVSGLDLAIFIVTANGVRVLDEVLSDSIHEQFSAGPHEVSMALPAVLNVGRHTVGVWFGTAVETLLEEPVAASFELLGSTRGRRDRTVVLDLPFSRTL
ncbi:MAG: polysaccharide ABC transporter ATP-binding protein [Acidimicrobiales bacterium]